MAITLYSGPPGAGKSFALVEQVILPAVKAGRRVLTNVSGVDPEKVWRYCIDQVEEPALLGRVVIFDGHQATEPGFFPTQAIPDTDTFVKGGDLIVFDEWKLYWPRRGKLPSDDLEPFLRWHRHLVNDQGVACDVAIATQLATDVHQDFRGLIERSYKFKKLKAVGLNKAYAWDAYEGHLQPKGGAYQSGNGIYKDEITALYSSYATTKQATELNSDGRASIFQKSLVWMGGAFVVVAIFSAWGVWNFFTMGSEGVANAAALPAVPGAPNPQGYSAPAPGNPTAPASSGYRIVGHVIGDTGTRVIVMDEKGVLRVVLPSAFSFDEGRPVEGLIDGKRVVAEDRVQLNAPGLQIPGLGS